MTPKRTTRIYWRNGRAWADFRDYADAGGRLEPLLAPGERMATKDADVAGQVAAARLKALDEARRRKALHGVATTATLEETAARYLLARRATGKLTVGWLSACEGFLQRAVDYFGSDRALESITVGNVRDWAAHLQTIRTAAGKRLGPESARRHLFTLSAVFAFAAEHELLPPGFNPVAAFKDKPPRSQHEAKWLEVPDAALLLESARTLRPIETPFGPGAGAELAYPLVATLLLTGGRLREVLGLELQDVSLQRKTVTFRPNTWRRLKTRTSARVVPLWPQLEEILGAYLCGPRLDRGGSLVFPSFASGSEALLTDVRKLLDRVACRVGWKKREINARMFRHTYCAARLQTLDHGAPVSPWTVARELGHSSDEMVVRVYAHLGTMRHRSPAVEFRVEQHHEQLRDRLAAAGFVTISDTKMRGLEKKTPRVSGIDSEATSYARARRDSNSRPLAPEASALSS